MRRDDGRTHHVLLLEDEPADAHLIRLALRETGARCAVDHVVDGVEGLDFLRRSGGYADAPRPDLILLDLNMPRMSGIEFLTQVKADLDLRRIPVLVMTTSSAERDVQESYLGGASGFVTKPAEMDQLFDVMRSVVDYWFGAVRLPQR